MALLNGLMPGESMGMPDQMTGLLGNPMLNIGLGILANNRGNYGSFGAAVGQGALQGLQNIQRQKLLDAQAKIQQRQLDEYDRKAQEQQAAKEAQIRLLSGQQGYMTEQEVPFTRTENVPMPAQQGAQAPNFNTMPQTISGVNKVPQFDNSKYMQDMVAAGYGDELIKMQLAPKKINYRDVGDKLIPYDEGTGMPRTDLEPISKGLTPDAQSNLMMRNYEFNNLSAAQKAQNEISLRGQNITLRGQNMTDSRAKEANKIKQNEVNNNIGWKYDSGSDEFVAPPTPEFPMGRRSGNVAKQNAAQSMDYIINQFRGDESTPGSLDKTMQGGILGASGRLGTVFDYQDQKRFNNLKEQMSTELRTLFRIPGEGSLSDKEQAQYGIQLPDVTYSKDTNDQILSDIQNRIKLRTQAPNPLAPPIMPKDEPMPSNGKMFDSLPKPNQYKGKIIRDDITGKRYQSNGLQWKEV